MKSIPPAKQKLVAKAIAGGMSYAEAALASGIGKSTIDRWAERPEFKKLVSEARAEYYQEGINAIVKAVRESAELLLETVRDKKTPIQYRISSAKTILDTANKAYLQEELERRIIALEERSMDNAI